jgi:hypothetical protein
MADRRRIGRILALGFFTGKSKGKKRMNKEWFALVKQKIRDWFTRPEGSEPHKSSNSNQGNLLEGTFFALGLVAFASLILGIISFSRPATRPAQNDISYEHLGFFAYTASAPSGIYDSNTVQSGDPIFPKINCSVDMTFQYTLLQGARKYHGNLSNDSHHRRTNKRLATGRCASG